MAPKTPSELREQIEAQQNEPASAPGLERTAEGMETPMPSRRSFFGNLRKVAGTRPLPHRDSSPDK
jgi:hypothetical protein